MLEDNLADHVAQMRRFTRFYTRRIGVLQEGLLDSKFSLAEARVLYELAHRDGLTAARLAKALDVDPGYLSRILRGFAQQGLIDKAPSAADGRESLLSLTDAGDAAFAPLDTRSRDEVGAMLATLAEPARRRLIGAMGTIEQLLGGGDDAAQPPYLLRPHRPGDIGWVTHRHGVLYAEEYGWDERFEAPVAEIAAKFVNEFGPKREHCWIPGRPGGVGGPVVLGKQSRTVANVRLR